MRTFTAALASGIASLALPFVLYLSIFLTGSGGEIEDAPLRASGLFLMLTPVSVLLCAAWFMGSTWALGRFGKLTYRSLVMLAVIISLLVAIVFAVGGFGVGGLTDAAISFAVFGICTFVCLTIGYSVWWLLRPAS